MAKQAPAEVLKGKASEITAAVESFVETRRAIFVWGPPGLGKSAILKQIATDRGIAYIDIRLSQMEPTDLRGIPVPRETNGVMTLSWASPEVLPRDMDIERVVQTEADGELVVRVLNPIGDNHIHHVTNPTFKVTGVNGIAAEIVEQGLDYFRVRTTDASGNPVSAHVRYTATGKANAILSLEELNSAPPTVQAASYQLTLDRRLGEYILPEGVFVVAAGNRDDDKGVTFQMPSPLRNRFCHVEMTHDFDEWQFWAIASGNVHPEVLGFLTQQPGRLYEFDAKSSSRAFATPRTWHAVSDFLNLNANKPVPFTVANFVISGLVGEATATEFMTFRRLADEMPTIENILNGTDTKLNPKFERDAGMQFMITTNICYKLRDEANKLSEEAGGKPKEHADYQKWMARMDRFIGYMIENFKKEITIMGFRVSIQSYKLPVDLRSGKNVMKFATEMKSVVINR